jgi:hypothetical protein
LAPTSLEASPKLRWQHPFGTDPSVHRSALRTLESADGSLAPIEIPDARHVGLDFGWPSHGSAHPLGGGSSLVKPLSVDRPEWVSLAVYPHRPL